VRVHTLPPSCRGRSPYGSQPRCGSVTGASRFLIGLVTWFATHGGIPAVARAAWRRETLGGKMMTTGNPGRDGSRGIGE
jgi:hypothetical protein